MPADLEPPTLLSKKERPEAARRVAIGLALFGLLDLAQDIITIIGAVKAGGSIHINLPLTFMGLWAAALVVWLDKRVIWPIIAYLSALTLSALTGGAIGCYLGLPTKLMTVFARSEPLNFWWNMGHYLFSAVFLFWLLREAERTRALWRESAATPTNSWLQPRACLAYLVLPSALLTWGLLSLLQGGWTKPAVERARAEYGRGYDYMTINYQFTSRNGRTTHQAVVLAYSEAEIRRIPLSWSD